MNSPDIRKSYDLWGWFKAQFQAFWGNTDTIPPPNIVAAAAVAPAPPLYEKLRRP